MISTHRHEVLLCVIFLMSFFTWSQEILISPASNIKDKVLFSEENQSVIGNGFFPISYSDANFSLPEKDTTRSWVARKLFTEHFVQKSGADFFLAVDPLLNMSIGKEQLQNTSDYLFQNTRGVQAFGHLKNKLKAMPLFQTEEELNLLNPMVLIMLQP